MLASRSSLAQREILELLVSSIYALTYSNTALLSLLAYDIGTYSESSHAKLRLLMPTSNILRQRGSSIYALALLIFRLLMQESYRLDTFGLVLILYVCVSTNSRSVSISPAI